MTAMPARAETPSFPGNNVFVTRQPIHTDRLNVFGYELLFRSSAAGAFGGSDQHAATQQVIENSFLTIGLPALTRGKRAFIQLTRELLLGAAMYELPHDQTVIEVRETVSPDDDILGVCRELRRRGFTLALDDFVCRPDQRPFLDLADIVRIDYREARHRDRAELERQLAPLRRRGVTLLAEQVETHAEFEQARELGFELFQGYFWGRPEIVSGKGIPTTSASYFRLLQQVHQRHFDVAATQEIVKSDPSLALSLLRYINCGLFRWSSRIQSVQHAIVILGRDEIRRWSSMMALTTAIDDDRPQELARAAVRRGRLCELIGQQGSFGDESMELFFTGLFSIAHLMLGLPKVEALAEIPISPESRRAILGDESQCGEILRAVEAYESGDWDTFTAATERLALPADQIPALYLEAVRWADAVIDGG